MATEQATRSTGTGTERGWCCLCGLFWQQRIVKIMMLLHYCSLKLISVCMHACACMHTSLHVCMRERERIWDNLCERKGFFFAVLGDTQSESQTFGTTWVRIISRLQPPELRLRGCSSVVKYRSCLYFGGLKITRLWIFLVDLNSGLSFKVI